jgi:peptidoglycan/xylan/chitin deacetylase (PgdA/CDA1 family)
LKNTSAIRNRILVCLCALAAVFFVAMTVWFYLIPVENYQLALSFTRSQASAAQEKLDARMSAAQAELNAAKLQNEELNRQLAELQNGSLIMTEENTVLTKQVEELEALPQVIWEVRTQYGEKIRQLEEMIMAGESDLRICYLTWDDGPNNMTGQIVKKMDELGVYATFFTIGSNSAPKQRENLRLEMMGGHTIANHTYSHAYAGSLYHSVDEFKKQVQKQDEKVFEATGFHTDIFRFPSGSVACPYMKSAEAWLQENGYQWIDWNASAWDAGMHAMNMKATSAYRNILYCCNNLDIAVVLCHDFNPATCAAMDMLVPEMREDGFVFLPLLPQSHMFDEPLPVV